MNRTEEYWALISDLDETPAALDTTLERARARRKKARAGKWLGIPVATLGGLASAFILLVNFSIPFALACGSVPFLRTLAATAAFSPTLKAAVENDYVQYVGQSQTVNGVTATIHYLILDPSQINIFYTIEGGDTQEYEVRPQAEGLGPHSYSGSSYTIGGPMGLINLSLNPAQALPPSFTLTLEVHTGGEVFAAPVPAEAPAQSAPFGEPQFHTPEPLARVSFDLAIDAKFTALVESLDVNQWIELDGQRLLVERLDVYPLAAALYLGDAEGNTAWLKSLHFYLEDGEGTRYGQGNLSLFSVGEVDSPAALTYYLESSYFTGADALTLHITDADWLDKEKRYATVDLTTGAAEGFPAGTSIERIERVGEDVHLSVRYPAVSSLFTFTHYDPEGGEHYRSYGASGSDDRGNVDYITLEDYPWDTVRLELDYTRTTEFPDPVTVTLK